MVGFFLLTFLISLISLIVFLIRPKFRNKKYLLSALGAFLLLASISSFVMTPAEKAHLAANLVDTRKKDFSEDDRSKLAQFITAKTSFDGVLVPLVVMISQDGYFQYHVGTVDGYDAATTEINAAQKSELKANLQKMFETYKRHNG